MFFKWDRTLPTHYNVWRRGEKAFFCANSGSSVKLLFIWQRIRFYCLWQKKRTYWLLIADKAYVALAEVTWHMQVLILLHTYCLFSFDPRHIMKKNFYSFFLESWLYDHHLCRGLAKLNPYSAEFKNGIFQYWISTNSFWHIRGFLAKIWNYDKQCSPWSESSSRSPLIWVYTVCKKVHKLVSSTIRVKGLRG